MGELTSPGAGGVQLQFDIPLGPPSKGDGVGTPPNAGWYVEASSQELWKYGMNEMSQYGLRYHIFTLILCLSLLISFQDSEAKTFAYGKRVFERYCGLTIGLDAYESYASLFYNVKKGPPREIKARNEMEFYWKLFLHSLKPYYFLVQSSDYPLPHATALFKQNNRRSYHDLDWDLSSTETNVLEMLASGYEEPYAFSLFLGYLTPFWQITEPNEKRQIGSAISGFVLTIGNRHIRDLELIGDNWYEIKWSLKGDKGTKAHHMKWNTQLGGKFHNHPEIFDTFFFRLYRDHLDREHYGLSFWQNSSFEYRAQIPVKNLSSVSEIEDVFSLHYLDIGKKFPSRRWKGTVYTINTGIYWEKYRDSRNGNDPSKTWSFFLRPNVVF